MKHVTIDRESATESRADFLIGRAEFAKALAFLAKHFIQPRNTIPILSNVLIDAGPESVRLVATDLDMMAELVLSADVTAPGRFTIPAATLADNLKKADSDRVYIRDGGEGRARVTSGRAAFNVPTLPADDFPVIAPPPGGKAFTLPAEWARDMAAVAPCMSKDSDHRYYLRGVALQLYGARLFMTALDGSNMAIIDRPAPAGIEGMSDAIIHGSAVSAMLAWAKATKAAGPLSLDMGTSRFRAELPGGLVVTSKLIDGTFPNWFSMIYGREAGPESCPMPALDPRLPMPAIERLARAAGAALAVDNFDNCALLTCADRPEFMGLVMHDRFADDAPAKPVPAESPARPYIAPEGQAADLFEVVKTEARRIGEGYSSSLELIGIKPGARKALVDEWQAYVRDYAKRCGLPCGDMEVSGYSSDGPATIAHFGGQIEAGRWETVEVQCWETLTTKTEKVWIAPEYEPGAFSIALPGHYVEPVTAQIGDGPLMQLRADDRKGYGPALDAVAGPDVKLSKAERASLKQKPGTPSTAQEPEQEAPAPVPVESEAPRYTFPDSYMDAAEGLPARATPTTLASACVAARVEAGEVATCSGAGEDMRRKIAARICEIVGHDKPGIGEPLIYFTLHGTETGPVRAYVESERGAWDHVIPRGNAVWFASKSENLPAQAQQALEAPIAPPEPVEASSEPEIGQDGAAIAAETTEIAFSAWLTAQFGPWIIAGRQSAKMTEAGKRAITPRQYAKLKVQWERGNIESAPPLVEKPGADQVAALVDLVQSLTARIEALEGVRLDQVSPAPDQLTPKRTRTPAHVRLLMRYLAMRKERERKRSWEAHNLRDTINTRNSLSCYVSLAQKTLAELEQSKAKRRRVIKRALRLRDSRAFWMLKADQWKDQWSRDVEWRDNKLNEAHTQAEILGKSLREASERALKAETALAAIEARANGWPPAAVSVKSVTFNARHAA